VKTTNNYPDNWPEIALMIKEKAGWRCERCNHLHDPQNGYTLGVAHLDHDKANCAEWNLAALCQRCHLHTELVAFETLINQPDMFTGKLPEWLKPHLEGYLHERRKHEVTKG